MLSPRRGASLPWGRHRDLSKRPGTQRLGHRGRTASPAPASSQPRCGPGQSIPGGTHGSSGMDPCSAEEGVWGRVRSWIPNLFPHPKNNHKHFCIQQLKETGNSSRKRGKKGKKAGFQIRDRANHRQTQPHMQQSTGNAGSPATVPINARDGSKGAADSTVLPAGRAGSSSG